MKLVGDVVGLQSNSATTISTVTEGWPLCGHDGVSCLICIELVAQTSALAIGWDYYTEDDNNNAKGKGWLVGIKEASFYKEKIPIDSRIRTQVEITLNMNNYSEVDGYTIVDDEQLSKVRLQVLRMDKEAGSE